MGLDRNELAARFAVALAGREGCAPTVAASEAVAYTDALLAALSPAPVVPDAPKPVAFKDGTQYPSDGERVVVARLKTTDGFIIHARHLSARKVGAVGTVTSYVPGHGGDVLFVQHDDGSVGAYCYDELAPAPVVGAPHGVDSKGQMFTCPNCGSHEFGTSNCTLPVSAWVGQCGNCHFSWPRELDDAKYFSPAPVPAATVPTPYAPRVGDVVGIDGGKEYGETRVVTGLDGDRVSYVRLNTKGDVLCRHTMESSLLTYLRPATAAERAAAGLSVDEAKPSAAPAETPALEHRRTVGAVVRGSQFGRRFIVIRSGDTDGAQRELPHPNARPVGAWPTDEFDGWATKEECDRHGVPFVDRSVDRTTPAAAQDAGLTEAELRELGDCLNDAHIAWVRSDESVGKGAALARAAAAWFAKRDGTVKP